MKHAATGAIAHQPLALVNARLVDPVRETEERGGVLVIDGTIRDFGPQVAAAALPPHAHIIDCSGDVVAPGLIDMCAFVGEPGAEHRETIATATAAAAAGGVTTILARPDTNPPIDEPAVVDFLLRRARDNGLVRVLPVAALTRGLHGEEIAEIGLLKEAGAVAFSDGPRSLRNTRVDAPGHGLCQGLRRADHAFRSGLRSCHRRGDERRRTRGASACRVCRARPKS